MWAMIVKEFRQLRRDRRTLAMMIVLPVLLLVVFGYAASFDVKSIPTVVAGPQAGQLPLPAPFHVVARAPAEGAAWAQTQLRDNRDGAALAVVTGGRTVVLVDGSQLFTARDALTALAARSRALPAGQAPEVRILFNPQLKTSYIMIPGLAGVVLAFIGIIITSLGVVRERQTGTLEQLAVMPLHPRDVFLGKIVPYFAVACVDLAIVLAVGTALFGVPFRGSYAVFGLGALLFLFVTLGLGVLISSVSENQGQAIQLSFMFTLPQVLLSGLIFPLASIAAGVRWISYLLPLTYFNEISRGVMLRAEPIGPLWQPLTFLALLGLIVMTLAMVGNRAGVRLVRPPAGPGSEAERATDVLVLDAGSQLAVGTPEQIVAAMPGRLRVSDTAPADGDRPRAWRRAGRWRVWDPDGAAGGQSVRPDLQDAVTVAILGRELAGAAAEAAVRER